MKPALLDVNVLLALAWPNHQSHHAATQWFASASRPWRTCATTQLAFVRLSSNPAFTPLARTPRDAWSLLGRMVTHPLHAFVAESGEPASAGFGALIQPLQGPKQITDAWLVHTAREHGCVLATFDRRLTAWAAAEWLEVL